MPKEMHYIELKNGEIRVMRKLGDKGIAFKFPSTPKNFKKALRLCRKLNNEMDTIHYNIARHMEKLGKPVDKSFLPVSDFVQTKIVHR